MLGFPASCSTTGNYRWLTWLEETDVGHTLPCLFVWLPHTSIAGLVSAG